MKKTLILTSLLTLVSALPAKAAADIPPPSQEIKSFTPFTGKVTGSKVRLRIEPNLEAPVVKELSKGEMFAVMDENNGYFGLKPTRDVHLFVFRSFVLDNAIEGDRVNVRLHPNLEAPIVAQLNSGDKVEIQGWVENNKWAEITIPEGVYFWVAKDYVESIGSIDYLAKFEKRKEEVLQFFKTAQHLAQAEFRKPFAEIDLDRTLMSFEKILKDFPEFEEYSDKAKESILKLKETYAEKKLAYLEGKASLPNYDEPLKLEPLDKVIESSLTAEFISHEPLSLLQRPIIELSAQSITDKMRIWEPTEDMLFDMWQKEHPGHSIQEFYSTEYLNSTQVTGILEPFNQPLKSKPGDYILKQGNKAVAYLYSTHVNLQDKVGCEVTLKVSPRENHSFAFPAYYVLSTQ